MEFPNTPGSGKCIAKTKGVRGDAESEGRRRQISGPTNRNRIRQALRIRPLNRSKSNNYTESVKAEYLENKGHLQRDSAEREAYAGAPSIDNREAKEEDGAELLEKVLSRENLNRAYKRVKATRERRESMA